MAVGAKSLDGHEEVSRYDFPGVVGDPAYFFIAPSFQAEAFQTIDQIAKFHSDVTLSLVLTLSALGVALSCWSANSITWEKQGAEARPPYMDEGSSRVITATRSGFSVGANPAKVAI